MIRLRAFVVVLALCVPSLTLADEPDHAIHEELRGVLRGIVEAIDAGQYERMLPYLTEDFEGTSITQEVMTGRAEVAASFREWFGPTGYMRSMTMQLDADELTQLSADKSWGLVRGKARALRCEGRRPLRFRHALDRGDGSRRRR